VYKQSSISISSSEETELVRHPNGDIVVKTWQGADDSLDSVFGGQGAPSSSGQTRRDQCRGLPMNSWQGNANHPMQIDTDSYLCVRAVEHFRCHVTLRR